MNARVIRAWLPLAATVVLVSGLVYGAAQQVLRQSAYDPQIQMAEDIAANLTAGRNTVHDYASTTADPTKSLEAFVIIFDGSGHPVASQVKLNGQTPVPPSGVFGYTKAHGEDRFTWQPAPGVRFAAVVKSYSGGYVLAARSLREVERREELILWQAAAGGLVILVASLAVTIIVRPRKAKS